MHKPALEIVIHVVGFVFFYNLTIQGNASKVEII